MIDSVFRAGKNYYPQVFLEKCKYVVKEKKMSEYVIDGIEISSDSDEKNTDEEILMKKILMRRILMKKILMKKILIKKFFYIFFLYIKMVNKYYQKHKEGISKTTT